MKTEQDIRDLLAQHRESLAGWTAPHGPLIPTEPDPEERSRVRAELRVAIYTLQWVLDERATGGIS